MNQPAYYEVIEPGRTVDGTYRGVWQPTPHAGGAWQPGEQHMGPISGLALHAAEEFVRLREAETGRRDGLQVARVGYDILGMIADGPTEVAVSVRRPGRTIELLESVVTTGRTSVTARVWRLLRGDSSAVAGGAPEPMPGPETWPVTPAFDVWQGGFIASLEARVEPGSEPGRTRTWLRPLADLVAGDSGPGSDLARFLGLVDGANGIAVRLPPQQWQFPNVDLTVHLYRLPTGPWVGFDTTVIFGPDGVGLTTTALHDVDGPVGRAEQILTLRPIAVGDAG